MAMCAIRNPQPTETMAKEEEEEEDSHIPVEWVDGEEWDAIEQALAAATSHFATGVEHAQHQVDVESTMLESKRNDVVERPRRTLPDWGRKKMVVQVQAPQLRMRVEAEPTTEEEPVVAQTNLSQLTDLWARARVAYEEKVRSGCQYLQFKGRLVYSKTYLEVDAAAHDLWEMVDARRASLPGNVSVGFDLEWKTSFQRGGAPGKVAVVQLCLESSRCDVMQIIHSGIPPSLVKFLEDPSIVKTGIGSRGDASKLQNDYGIQTRGVVDLSEMANQKLGRRWQSWSLSSLAEGLTCKKVEKMPSIRCGDWEACPLSSLQLQYAATDAFASLYFYQILESFSNYGQESEESSSDSPLMQQGSAHEL